MDRPYFIGSFWLPPAGGGGGGRTTNTTAVDWLLKVKNIEYDVGLT